MRAIGLAIAVVVATPGVAWAEGCTVEPQDLSLGDYDPFAAAPQDAVGTISVRCDTETNFVVTLGPGNGSYRMRRMVGGGQTLLYNLFLDLSRTTVWGDGSDGSSGLNRSSLGGNFAVYARAVAGQSTLRPGPYVDVIDVTVTY